MLLPRDLGETTESNPLYITDLFQNKYLAYFWLINCLLGLFYAIFQCGRKNISKKTLYIFFAHKKLRKVEKIG